LSLEDAQPGREDGISSAPLSGGVEPRDGKSEGR
jgi:hypothetical protein